MRAPSSPSHCSDPSSSKVAARLSFEKGIEQIAGNMLREKCMINIDAAELAEELDALAETGRPSARALRKLLRRERKAEKLAHEQAAHSAASVRMHGIVERLA